MNASGTVGVNAMQRLFVFLFLILFASSYDIDIGSASSGSSKDKALLEKIEVARGLVGRESVQMIKGVVGTRKVRVGRRKYREVEVTGIVGREMAIAIMDGNGSITVARGIKRDKGLEVLTEGVILHVRRDNGINSDIAVISPRGGKVLAVKYPVSNEGERFGPGGEVIEAVYTPYSPDIHTRAVIEEGIVVQSEFIDKAYAALKRRGVKSHAFPGRDVADVMPKGVLTVLLMNEHIDPGLFKTEGLTRGLVEQVLTILGTNGGKAYAYSISSAGARGLVQMIPSTYRLIARKYPGAGLKPDFALGMVDVVNAIVAQVLLCDADWESMLKVSDLTAEEVGPYLAAAYNGGVGRVISILRQGETDWMESPESGSNPSITVTRRVPVRVKRGRGRARTRYVLKSYTQPVFRSETSKYVRQYHWINDYFVARVEGEEGKRD
jgi:hypothetical protein